MPGVKFAFCCCDKQDGLMQLSGQWNFSVLLRVAVYHSGQPEQEFTARSLSTNNGERLLTDLLSLHHAQSALLRNSTPPSRDGHVYNILDSSTLINNQDDSLQTWT